MNRVRHFARVHVGKQAVGEHYGMRTPFCLPLSGTVKPGGAYPLLIYTHACTGAYAHATARGHAEIRAGTAWAPHKGVGGFRQEMNGLPLLIVEPRVFRQSPGMAAGPADQLCLLGLQDEPLGGYPVGLEQRPQAEEEYLTVHRLQLPYEKLNGLQTAGISSRKRVQNGRDHRVREGPLVHASSVTMAAGVLQARPGGRSPAARGAALGSLCGRAAPKLDLLPLNPVVWRP